MTGISPINNTQANKQRYFNSKYTGYIAATSLVLTTIAPKIKPLKKFHKFLGLLTCGLMITHIATCYHNTRLFNKTKHIDRNA